MPTYDELVDVLKEAQKVNSLILLNGGTNIESWWCPLITAQQKIGRLVREAKEKQNES